MKRGQSAPPSPSRGRCPLGCTLVYEGMGVHLAAAHGARELAEFAMGLLRLVNDRAWIKRVAGVNAGSLLGRAILAAWPGDHGVYGTEEVATWVGERQARVRKRLRLMARSGVVRELRCPDGPYRRGDLGGLWQISSGAEVPPGFDEVASRS